MSLADEVNNVEVEKFRAKLSESTDTVGKLRKLVGEPTSSWLRTTIKEELGDLCRRMSKVEDELKPNGGKSLRDRVEFIAGKVDK